MEWLTLWLKKIILLVLLAAFLDLILPNTSLQRYVKMVMGLILMLTILSPVFSLFQLSQEELAYRVSQYQADFQNATRVDWQPLAKRLAGQQQAQVTSYVKKELEGRIKQEIKAEYGQEPAEVVVELADPAADQPVIKEITVIMGTKTMSTEQAEQAVPVVKPIEPVNIDLSRKQQTAPEPSRNQVKPQDEAMVEWLARNWELEKTQIVVLRPDRNDIANKDG